MSSKKRKHSREGVQDVDALKSKSDATFERKGSLRNLHSRTSESLDIVLDWSATSELSNGLPSIHLPRRFSINKQSKMIFKDDAESMLEKIESAPKDDLSSKVLETLPHLKAVLENRSQSIPALDMMNLHFLEFLEETSHFSMDLSKSFLPEKKPYDANLDLHTKRLYTTMCRQQKMRALPVILNNLDDPLFQLQQWHIPLKMFIIFMECLKHNQKIEVLELLEGQLNDRNLVVLGKMLLSNVTIFSLNLSRNCFGQKGLAAIAEALENSYSLIALYLSGNNLTSQDVIPLLNSLLVNYFITMLDLSYNKISFETGRQVTETLMNNETLIYLDLQWCHIGEKGCLALSEGLSKNSGLRVLDLSWNRLGDRGFMSLCSALTTNTTLRVLNVGNNNLHQNSIIHITRLLKKNKVLEILILDNNYFGYQEDFLRMKQLLLTYTKHISLSLLSLQGYHPSTNTLTMIKDLQELNNDLSTPKILLHTDCVTMNVLNEAILYACIKLLVRFVEVQKHLLESWFHSDDPGKTGEITMARVIMCLEKSGFYIPLQTMRELLQKLERNNRIPYETFFDGTLLKMLDTHKRSYRNYKVFTDSVNILQ